MKVSMEKTIHIFLVTISLFFTSFYFAKPRIYIIHGVNAQNASWHQKFGDFHKSLEKEAKKFGEEVKDFSWNQPLGGFSELEVASAGQGLALELLEYLMNGGERIIIYAHSMGGYVARFASQLLKRFINANDRIINESEMIKPPLFDEAYDNFEKTIRFFGYEERVRNACNKFETTRAFDQLGFSNKKHIIDALVTFGTPNGYYGVYANRNVIGKLYNITSDGDWLQDVVASEKLIEEERREDFSVNIKILKADEIGNDKVCGCFKGCRKAPSHSQLHDPIIGKWFFEIPWLFGSNDISNDFFQHDWDVELTGRIVRWCLDR